MLFHSRHLTDSRHMAILVCASDVDPCRGMVILSGQSMSSRQILNVCYLWTICPSQVAFDLFLLFSNMCN